MAKVINKTKGFGSISRDCVYDNDLSDRARFLYVYMACKPEDWEFYQDKVAEELNYKKDTLRKYLDELIVRGWVTEKEQHNDGKFGCLEYVIEIERKSGNLPIRKKPDTEKTRYGKNPNQRNIDNISSDIKSSDINRDIEEKSILKKNFQKPTVEQVEAYIQEKGLHFDAERFVDHYESKGWMIGKNKMKDWKAACRTWEHIRNSQEKEKEEKENPDTSSSDWDAQKRWLDINTPNIAGRMTKEMLRRFKELCMCDSYLLADTLREFDKIYDGGDMMKEFEELCKKR